MDFPARENHRLIPVELDWENWWFQYSPYVYYNEHCIVLCEEHRPMKIDGHTFRRLLDFVGRFPTISLVPTRTFPLWAAPF